MGEERLHVQEMSDKLSLEAVTTVLPVRMFGAIVVSSIQCYFLFQDWHDRVKSFGEQHDYDGLVVLLSITAEHRPSDQQVAVFSKDTDLLNQVPI